MKNRAGIFELIVSGINPGFLVPGILVRVHILNGRPAIPGT